MLETSGGIISGKIKSRIDLNSFDRFFRLNFDDKKSNRFPVEIGSVIFNYKSRAYLSKDGEVWSYEYKYKDYTSLSDNGCFPLLWLNENNKILCNSLNFKNIFIYDLNNGVKKALPVLDGAYGFIYESSRNSLLYGKTEGSVFGEKYSIYKYDLSNDEEYLILKDSHLSGGDI